MEDYPLEQYVRDAKIDTLYEGTTAIQGQDLFFPQDRPRPRPGAGGPPAQVQTWLDSGAGDDSAGHASGDGQLKEERALLQTALEDAGGIVAAMIGDLTAAQSPDRAREVYKSG